MRKVREGGFFAGFIHIPVSSVLGKQGGVTSATQQGKDFSSKQRILHLNCTDSCKEESFKIMHLLKRTVGKHFAVAGPQVRLQESMGDALLLGNFTFYQIQFE